MSLLLFGAKTYDKFFATDGSLNATGEWSMFFGIMGITAYLIMFFSFILMDAGKQFQETVRSSLFGIVALTLSAIHVTVMGFKGWLTPGQWHGCMPPVTMVCILIFLIGMTVFFFLQAKHSKYGKQSSTTR
jgi:hypothetical protein